MPYRPPLVVSEPNAHKSQGQEGKSQLWSPWINIF